MWTIYWKKEEITGSYQELKELMTGYIGVPITRIQL